MKSEGAARFWMIEWNELQRKAAGGMLSEEAARGNVNFLLYFNASRFRLTWNMI